jgi:glycosyltransferase involved in cell wall biosynthesis
LGAPVALDLVTHRAQPALTVCIPTYSRPALVQRAIRSVIHAAAGAESQVEIIVSDNSPDESEAACREALAAWNGPSQYLGNRPDVGMAGNFNQCIERASGKYVLFVHDDDQLLPGAAQAILRALETPGAPGEVLFFGVDIVDEAQRTIRRQHFGRDVAIPAPVALQRLLSDNAIAWFPGLLVSRDAYVAVGPFDSQSGNALDLDMWVRLFSAYGLRCVPSSISAYSVHEGSATQTTAFDRAMILKILTIFERAAQTGALSAETVRQCQAGFLPQVILGTAALYLRAGNNPGAREVMGLFGLPPVRSMRLSRAWLPVRLMFSVLARTPSAIVRPFMRLVDRWDLVHRVRAAQERGEGTLPFR